MLDWLEDNWGNVASVVGLVLALPSLWFSFWAWREAKSAERLVASWHKRQALASAERVLNFSLSLCRDLRKCKAQKWPRPTRGELRDALLEVLHSVEWSEELRSLLVLTVAELRHEIVTSIETSAYLETIIDLIVECRAVIRLQLRSEVI